VARPRQARKQLVGEIGRATQAYQRATDGFDDAVGRILDLNPTDLRCLDWLTDGPMSAGALAQATGLSSAATTTLLDRLEAGGYVRRARDSHDRRRVLIDLTASGRERLWDLYGPLASEGASLLERFSGAELAALRDFLVDATGLVDRHRDRLRHEAGRRGAPARSG
jgi:DNA-binding MarR family transcriptional regulator